MGSPTDHTPAPRGPIDYLWDTQTSWSWDHGHDLEVRNAQFHEEKLKSWSHQTTTLFPIPHPNVPMPSNVEKQEKSKQWHTEQQSHLPSCPPLTILTSTSSNYTLFHVRLEIAVHNIFHVSLKRSAFELIWAWPEPSTNTRSKLFALWSKDKWSSIVWNNSSFGCARSHIARWVCLCNGLEKSN